jgi:hypothetical protein
VTDQHIETVRNAHNAFSAGNLEEAAQLVANRTDFTDHGRGQTLRTRSEFRAWLSAFKLMSSDIQLVDAKYIAGGEWLTALFRAVGTQDGSIGSFAASGRRFALDVCEVWHFNANGEADEGRNYSDGLGLLIQLGHITPPGA